MSHNKLLTAGALVLLLASFTTPAAADSYRGGSCSVTAYNVHFSGANRIWYFSSGSKWELRKATYSFGPARAVSTHNNKNLDFFGGSNWYSQNSADNLLRDGKWHEGLGIYPAHHVFGTKTASYAQFQDIFDVPGEDDPRCTAQTDTF